MALGSKDVEEDEAQRHSKLLAFSLPATASKACIVWQTTVS